MSLSVSGSRLKAVFGYPYPVSKSLSCWISNRQSDHLSIEHRARATQCCQPCGIPVAPPFKGQGGSALVMQPRSGVPGLCLCLLCDCSLVLLSPFPLVYLVKVTPLVGVTFLYFFKKFRVYVWGVCLSFSLGFTFTV